MMRGIADDVGFPLHAADLAVADRIISLGIFPTQVLQDALHPETGPDLLAMLATVVYMLHFVLPLATGFVLWAWRRTAYYDFVAGLVLRSAWLASSATCCCPPRRPGTWPTRACSTVRTEAR